MTACTADIRGSLRARVFSGVARRTLRPLIDLAPTNELGVCVARELLACAMRVFGPPLADATVTPVAAAGMAGEWVYARTVDRTDKVILYIHGGGFVAGSPYTHRGVSSRLSAATGLPIFAAHYRLAPQHPFPAAVHDVSATYRWLLRQGFAPEDIVLAGDSAGAQLATDLVLTGARQHAAPPAALVLFSPMVDLSLELAQRHRRTRRDPLLSVAKARELVELYTEGRADARLELRPEASMALPPMLIQVGDAELVAADAVELAHRWHAVDARCELQMWPDQVHVFHALPVLVPESAIAFAEVARFLGPHLDSDTARAV